MKKKISVLLLIVLMSSFTLSFASSKEVSPWAIGSIKEIESYDEFTLDAFDSYQSNITRGEFIYIAVRVYELLADKEIIINPNVRFNDTNDVYAIKGASLRITDGTGDGKFSPNVLLTREQLAVLMTNTLKLSGKPFKDLDGYRFKDEDTFSTWAKDAIYLAKVNGLISGVGNDKFDAKRYATIEQTLAIANKMLKNNGYVKVNDKSIIADNSDVVNADISQEPQSLFNDDATKSDYVIELLKNLPKDIKVDDGITIIGSEHYANKDYLYVYTQIEDRLSFQILDWNKFGVEEMISESLNIWFEDGEAKFDKFVKEKNSVNVDKSSREYLTVSSDSFKNFMTDGDIAVWMYVKK